MIDPEAWELLDRPSQNSSRLPAKIADINLEQLSTEQAIIRLSLILSLSQALRDDIKTFQAVTRIARE
ncbi:hypothetical protein ATX60_10750 [Oenococcus oeni]|uniref:hypothetical protein n=1 Tax=Oenococcus oeni TaxID=1247 RepID=UPI0008F83C0A|nr:hypothetical protein [Oenococcus oeni]OIM21292.1 hypothetical protein ATX60_10750 [Oenococcus oeni]